MELSTSVGVIEFRLSASRVRSLPSVQSRPFTLLEDGTEVRLLIAGDARYLLVDHRRDPDRPAHVEFWECTATPELELAGLWAMCDAASAPGA